MSKQVRPFGDFIQELNHGGSHSELSAALNELVTAVSDLGKGGTLTYTIKVAPAGRAEGMVTVTDDVKLKLPVGARPDSVFFITPDGNLMRDNPAQPRLPLREVPRPGAATTDSEEVAR